jgi:hypothetical protein
LHGSIWPLADKTLRWPEREASASTGSSGLVAANKRADTDRLPGIIDGDLLKHLVATAQLHRQLCFEHEVLAATLAHPRRPALRNGFN